MREKLANIEGVRGIFSATVGRFGMKKGFKFPLKTILFRDVKDIRGQVVTDHLWFTMGKQLKDLNLAVGDSVMFNARVQKYQKGYKGRVDDFTEDVSIDYGLKFPTNVRKVTNEEVQESQRASIRLMGVPSVRQPDLFGDVCMAVQPQGTGRALDNHRSAVNDGSQEPEPGRNVGNGSNDIRRPEEGGQRRRNDHATGRGLE